MTSNIYPISISNQLGCLNACLWANCSAAIFNEESLECRHGLITVNLPVHESLGVVAMARLTDMPPKSEREWIFLFLYCVNVFYEPTHQTLILKLGFKVIIHSLVNSIRFSLSSPRAPVKSRSDLWFLPGPWNIARCNPPSSHLPNGLSNVVGWRLWDNQVWRTERWRKLGYSDLPPLVHLFRDLETNQRFARTVLLWCVCGRRK